MPAIVKTDGSYYAYSARNDPAQDATQKRILEMAEQLCVRLESSPRAITIDASPFQWDDVHWNHTPHELTEIFKLGCIGWIGHDSSSPPPYAKHVSVNILVDDAKTATEMRDRLASYMDEKWPTRGRRVTSLDVQEYPTIVTEETTVTPTALFHTIWPAISAADPTLEQDNVMRWGGHGGVDDDGDWHDYNPLLATETTTSTVTDPGRPTTYTVGVSLPLRVVYGKDLDADGTPVLDAVARIIGDF